MRFTCRDCPGDSRDRIAVPEAMLGILLQVHLRSQGLGRPKLTHRSQETEAKEEEEEEEEEGEEERAAKGEKEEEAPKVQQKPEPKRLLGSGRWHDMRL